MQIKGRIFGWLLMSVLIVPVSLTFLWLHYERATIRSEVFQILESGSIEDELSVLRIANNELTSIQWMHEREFRYESRMYDVVRKEFKQDSLIIYCRIDHDETVIDKRMNRALRLVYGSDFPTQQSELQLTYLLNNLDLPTCFCYTLHNTFQKQEIDSYKYRWTDCYVELDNPPPQL